MGDSFSFTIWRIILLSLSPHFLLIRPTCHLPLTSLPFIYCHSHHMGSSHFVPAIFLFQCDFPKVVSSRGFLSLLLCRVIFHFMHERNEKFGMLFILLFTFYSFSFLTSAACWGYHMGAFGAGNFSLSLSLVSLYFSPFHTCFCLFPYDDDYEFLLSCAIWRMSVASPYCVKEGLDNLRRAFAARGGVSPSCDFSFYSHRRLRLTRYGDFEKDNVDLYFVEK